MAKTGLRIRGREKPRRRRISHPGSWAGPRERRAGEHGIPVRSDPDLVALLAICQIGAEIPTELYTAVAELLVWLYRANHALGAAEASVFEPPPG